MQIAIENLLTSDEVREVRDRIEALAFEDGRRTAGWNARLVKNNTQAKPGDAADRLRDWLEKRISSHEVFAAAVRPKAMTPLLLSRYVSEQAYGSHVDDPIMNGMRTDVSFTLFLSDPDTYEGGELVMETAAGEDAVKLPAGGLFLYPSTTLHRVAPVRSGERLVAAGWARSHVRDPGQREILFDLDRARRAIFERDGKTAEFDLLSKSVANLTRHWADD